MKKRFLHLLGVGFLILAFIMPASGHADGDSILYDFEGKSSFDKFEWKCFTLFSLSEDHVTYGKHSLKLEFFPSNYPQIETRTQQYDWSGYKSLSIDIFNPGNKSVRVYIRIDDREEFPDYGNRYTKPFQLMPGENHLVISLSTLISETTGRHLDISTIYRFFLFMFHPNAKVTLFIDNIRLHM